MLTRITLLGASAFAVTAFGAAPGMPVHRGTVSINKPAFLGVEKLGENTSLVITSFGLSGNDAISVIPDLPGAVADASRADPQVINYTVTWPNQARKMPAGIVDFNAMLAVGGFFPIPWKNTGTVNIINLDAGDPNSSYKISNDKSGWWYHNAIWRDMNGDGRLDVLTARARKGMLGGGGGELLWLEQPADNVLAGPWKEHVLTEGPDVYFVLEDLDGDGSEEIIATEFNAKRLTFYRTGADGKLTRKVIDDTLGAAFAVTPVDLNRDGRKELLVTNHENKADRSAVFAYEIPADLNGKWPRHTLLTGIVTQGGMGQASPGHALPIHPTAEHATTEAPWIVVSGDGSREAYLLVPETTPWKYKAHTILKTGGIVGKPTFADVNGDGATELFIPAYDDNQIHIFSWAN